MNVKISYNTLVYAGENIADGIRRLAKFGYDGVDFVGEPDQFDTAEICRLLKENNIRLTLEAWNRYETYLITKLDMALKMVNEVGLENVGVMGDTFHMNIEESNMGDAIRNVGKKLYYLHIADSNRAAPGRGHIDFEEIAQALKDIDYNGWISMELLPAAANPFSGIVQEEFYDQYTEESITYLKKLFS